MKDTHSGGTWTGACTDESGATAIEYAMIAALISVVILGAVEAIGTDVLAFFETITDQL